MAQRIFLREFVLAGLLVWALPEPVNASLQSKARHLLPDHGKLQSGGNIGFLALGMGYEHVRGKVHSDFFYGYVPEQVGGTSIHTVAHKLTVRPLQFRMPAKLNFAPLTFGMGTHLGIGSEYFLVEPDLPWDYYWPSALHFQPFIGNSLTWQGGSHAIDQMSTYMELGALDFFWRNYFEEGSIGLADILTLSVGASLGF